MGTGPGIEEGADLTLTELPDGDHFKYLVRADTEAGIKALEPLSPPVAGDAFKAQAQFLVESAKGKMGRKLDIEGLPEILAENLNHKRWDEVAERCITCANCTMVCPTCFCTDVDDVISLDGGTSTRMRHWDSCFTTDFSYIHGGGIRQSTKARYRQWATHKLSSWVKQFGTEGCVGCGRCITWCPPGIDITEEAGAIRASSLKAEA
jgi:ferredoxin